ncbi:MAG: RecX family transcriptional regulator [Chloroflexi bacterium]|nr:RecX family transcriptional regulator [Chloroflexota bacterium]
MAEADATPRARRRRPADPPEPPGPEAALEIALLFLGNRPRTWWELERRLRRATVADEVIVATLERLSLMGYLDDAAFARWWAEQRDRHAPRGRRLLEAELRQRGVPRDVIEAHREADPAAERAPEDEGLPETDEERARVALERHLRGRPLPAEPKALQRISMFLVRRGFDTEVVRATLRGRGSAEAEDG